jgi:hypothetical protein
MANFCNICHQFSDLSITILNNREIEFYCNNCYRTSIETNPVVIKRIRILKRFLNDTRYTNEK